MYLRNGASDQHDSDIHFESSKHVKKGEPKKKIVFAKLYFFRNFFLEFCKEQNCVLAEKNKIAFTNFRRYEGMI